MEKLNEEWTSRRVASYFKIQHKDGRPTGCNSRSDYIFSKTCGLGWRFALRCDDEVDPPEIEIYFDPYVADTDMSEIRVATKHFDEGSASMKARVFDTMPRGLEMLSCWQLPDIIMNPLLCFVVIFPPLNFTGTGASESLTLPRKVLADSMDMGSFVDIKFLAFSKRTPSNAVATPKPVFANSTLLAQKGKPTILDKCRIGGSFGPTFITLEKNAVCPEELNMNEYGYESDSDLGDPDYESDLEYVSEKTDSDTATIVGEEQSVQESSSRQSLSIRDNSPPYIHQTILLKDTAFATWQALVYYVYTNEIIFSPLRSQGSIYNSAENKNSGFPCSPKSMYRLAHKLELADLKTEAFKAITERINEDNVLDEVFSRFTSRYPEILEMEIDALCRYWNSPEVVADFPKKMASIVAGKLPHSFAVLAKFSPPHPKS